MANGVIYGDTIWITVKRGRWVHRPAGRIDVAAGTCARGWIPRQLPKRQELMHMECEAQIRPRSFAALCTEEATTKVPIRKGCGKSCHEIPRLTKCATISNS